ncbi:MAG: hypothetical protein E7241_04715 [Lachnospiraceae bacterium]|nr:hypothetical protein [Lachnospiraceae bacterium]
MKNIILILVAVILCIALSIVITRLISKKKNIRKSIRIVIATLLTVVLLLSASLSYLMIYYHSDSEALDALKTDENVTVSETNTAWFFDGAGTDKALIFYPGGKVEETAYAPILRKLAEKGIDCFLVKMPFRMAVFGVNKADEIMSTYSYGKWYMGGHSLGGAMAANYAASHSQDIAGLIMLAAYPTAKIDDGMLYLSIYGSCDRVMAKDSYEKYKTNWPKNAVESVIDGGNHSQFGSYGFQEGDGEATISRKEQEEKTVREILIHL